MNDTSLGINRFINVIKKTSAGAYGMASETSSVSNLSHNSDGQATYKLKNKNNYTYTYHEPLYICKGTKVYPASLKSFQKVYPKIKGEIAVFVKDNDIDFDNLESLKTLYQYCISNTK